MHDFLEVYLPGAGSHHHFFWGLEILYTHAGYQTIDGWRVIHRVQFALGIKENVAGIVPDAEVFVPDQFNYFPAFSAVGIFAAIS